MDDRKQLTDFAERGDQDAFAALVKRHAGLVYSAARRQWDDPTAAEDVVQVVFALLTKKQGR